MDFSALLQQGNAWFYIPSAILLGALHGLEPGHSKTMMASFIVAIRGTVKQAVMLGVAATLSHTLIVWLIAIGGMYISQELTAESAEPWIQLISGIIVFGTGIWMIGKMLQEKRQWTQLQNQNKAWNAKIIDTGHGIIKLSLIEKRFKVESMDSHTLRASELKVLFSKPNSFIKQEHGFTLSNNEIVSDKEIKLDTPLEVKLSIGHHNHVHSFDVTFDENSIQAHEETEYQDAHEKAHAQDIKKRFENKNVTDTQIIVFGLTGGLIPCPAAVTVLLLCLQLKEIALGATMVLCFSIGLAITLVSVGVIAAIGTRKAASKFSKLNALAQKAPYLSGLLICAVGLYMSWYGLSHLFQV
ncbi:MAG: nickel/cobalt efflux transporter [Pseudomonadota bacterium]|nr:nickel/cobalt efflux transporter [Pseudomonadota bacterium]